MKVQVVHIEACAGGGDAAARTRAALDELGLTDVDVEHVLVRSAEEASTVFFAGSPTILLDGDDAFPSQGRTADLACRVYMTDHGLADSPTQEQIREAISARL